MSKEEARARARALALEHWDRGDGTGWFEEFYKEAEGDPAGIPWGDLEPNQYLADWARQYDLKGDGRTALVVGCGLGDDAQFLRELGFHVTAFDISPTAIEWAKKLYPDGGIRFLAADLFDPPAEWRDAFDFVLEVYTIQPLPLEMRTATIDAIASFVKPEGRLLVVTRGRDDDDEPEQLPWPVSRRDLSRFETHGMVQRSFTKLASLEEDEPDRFVVLYERVK